MPSTPGSGRGRPSPAVRPFTPPPTPGGCGGRCSGPSCPRAPQRPGARPGSAAPQRSRRGPAGGGAAHAHCSGGHPHASLSQYCGRRTRACATAPTDACALTTAAHTALSAGSQAFRAGVRLAHAQSFPPVVPRFGNGSSLRSNQRDSAARLLCGLLLGSASAVRLRGALTGLRPLRGKLPESTTALRMRSREGAGGRCACAAGACAVRRDAPASRRGAGAGGFPSTPGRGAPVSPQTRDRELSPQQSERV